MREADDVGPLLHQRGGAFLQLDLVAVVGFAVGRIEALDLAVGDAKHGHATGAQLVELVEVLVPDGVGLDVAFAVAGSFDGRPVVDLAHVLPDERLQPVETVQHHRAKVVLFREQRVHSRNRVVVGGDEREGIGLDASQAILKRQEDGLVGAGAERGLAHAVFAVDDDARRYVGAGGFGDGGEGDSHYAASCCSMRSSLTAGLPGLAVMHCATAW